MTANEANETNAPGFDACSFFVLCGDRCVVHRVNSSFAIFVLFVLFVA
jgi:hypothetical protein